MKNEPAPIHNNTDKFAASIALITHPVVIGVLALFTVVFQTLTSWHDRLFYLFILMLMTFLPAVLYLFVLFKGNVVEMLELINREARLIPYLLMIIGAILAVMVLTRIKAPYPIFVMTLVLLANEIVLGTINFWTKVSIHTATAAFSAITLGYLMHPFWYGLILLVPIIGWARIHRKRHTLYQVIGGAVFGSLITITVLLFSPHWI